MAEYGSYVAGRFVPSDTGRENINPSNRADVIGVYASSPASLVAEAYEAARAAQPGWAATSPQVRANLLEAVATRIFARSADLGRLLAREEGKTLAEAVGEVERAAQIFRFFSGEAMRLVGDYQDSTRPGVTVTTSREPLGVIGIITPWNFPIAIPAWKMAPALAYGKTLVIKPADLVPASTHAVFRIFDEVALPAGVANLVLGPGSTVGQAMLDHPGFDGLTFTGSENVGRTVAAAAAARFQPVQLEMGGKNPLVIASDADLSLAVEVAVAGSFFSTGQRCTASSRLIADAAIHDEFVERLHRRMAGLVVGDALDPATHIGPVVDEKQLATDLEYLALGRSLPGAEVLGGETFDEERGFFLRPAVILGAGPQERVNQEEIFGPVVTVLRADDHDHAVALANDVRFGLSAGICTTSLFKASDFQRRSDAGMVMVNLPTAGVDPHVSFGGRKGSSYGPKEQGSHAREFFTQAKIAYVQG
jgi:aldehyde dehydrogenase (NAD+)